jgi:hypothetical protein
MTSDLLVAGAASDRTASSPAPTRAVRDVARDRRQLRSIRRSCTLNELRPRRCRRTGSSASNDDLGISFNCVHDFEARTSRVRRQIEAVLASSLIQTE